MAVVGDYGTDCGGFGDSGGSGDIVGLGDGGGSGDGGGLGYSEIWGGGGAGG